MKDFLISTESTCDFSEERLNGLSVSVIKMPYYVDDEEFGGDTGRELDQKTFYDKMRNGSKTHTSMINEESAKEYFSSLLKEGKDILHVSFAKACSGTYDNMLKASEELNKTSTNKIYVVESKCESSAQGLLVELCVSQKKSGKSIQEVFDYANDVKERINSLFTVETLKYLEAGGRVSKTTAIVGNILNIKPLLYVNSEGKLIAGGKVVSRKLSLSKLAKMTTEKFSGEYNKIYVSHCDCEDDASFVAQKIASVTKANILLENIGPVIGSHSGPGTIAIFFLGKDRRF